MTARVMPMDPEGGDLYRVSRCDSDDAAVAAAAARFAEDVAAGLHADYVEDGPPSFTVTSSGWYRCVPCFCGMEHRYDMWPAEQGQRGAFFTRLVGWR